LAVLNKTVQQLQQAIAIISQKDEEIKKFRDFCVKSKIQYPPEAPTPATLPDKKK